MSVASYDTGIKTFDTSPVLYDAADIQIWYTTKWIEISL